jgi:hypothetical protein
MDLRKTLYGNIVLSGGSTLFKGTLLKKQWLHAISIYFNDPGFVSYNMSILVSVVYAWEECFNIVSIPNTTTFFSFFSHSTYFLANLFVRFPGFGDRLLSEVKKLAPKDIKIRVRYYAIIYEC